MGLVLVFWVSLNMLWEGHRDVVERTGHTATYNRYLPDFMDIHPGAHHRPGH